MKKKFLVLILVLTALFCMSVFLSACSEAGGSASDDPILVTDPEDGDTDTDGNDDSDADGNDDTDTDGNDDADTNGNGDADADGGRHVF